MKNLLKQVEENLVAARNNLTYKCSAQINAAIRAGNKLQATSFVMIVFDVNLKQAAEIVDKVRNFDCDFQDITIQRKS